MLTIGQLASYVGVTVRAVRHYHAKGLLREPQRDHCGYRRYDALAVVDLIKIRTLADAGVPLGRVRELLAAGDEEFATAIADIDRRLRAEITQRQRHRQRIAQLAAGDNLALPPQAVAYLDRMRELGLPGRFIDGERDAWILVAAQLPEQMPLYMTLKQQQLDDPPSLELYRELAEAIDWEPDDPRLRPMCDRLVALLDADADGGGNSDAGLPDELVQLLDSMFVDLMPIAPRFMELLEERGWRGLTQLERIAAARIELPPRPGKPAPPRPAPAGQLRRTSERRSPLRPIRRASCSGRPARRSSSWRRSRRRTPPSPRRSG